MNERIKEMIKGWTFEWKDEWKDKRKNEKVKWYVDGWIKEKINWKRKWYKADIYLVSRVEPCQIEDVLRLLGTCKERILSAVLTLLCFISS